MIDTSLLTNESEIAGDSKEDTVLLQAMVREAHEYMSGHAWMPGVRSVHFGLGVGGLVAVFLFTFSEAIKGRDDQLWVIVGDIPSAYLVIDECRTPEEALACYCSLMMDWVSAVRRGTDLKDVFPVRAEPSVENADSLERRVRFIEEDLI